ncbi:MAG: hypothetical protein ACI4VB_03555 [Bradymonadia bacterium]
MAENALAQAKTTKKDAAPAAKKEAASTVAKMKGISAKKDKGAEKSQETAPQAVDKGSTKQQVTALLNVYTDQASEQDNARVSAILSFLKGVWSSIKSFFSKKEKTPTGVTSNLNKEEILAKLVELFECSDNLAEIAADGDLMHRIMTEMPDAERNSALDCLYDNVTDPQLLIEMIDLRFGVTVIDSRPETHDKLNDKARAIALKNTPIDWTAAGLIEVYKVYTFLPQSDLDLIQCLMHLDDTSVGGAAYGYSNSTTGVYYVNYRAGNEKMQEIVNPANDGKGKVSGHSDHSSDRRNNTIMMDMTTAHELGHIVDGNSGWKISGPGSSMRNVSKWQETPDDPNRVVEEMVKSISGTPYDGALTDAELKIAKDVGAAYLAKDQNAYAGKWSAAVTELTDQTELAVEKSGDTSIDAEELADKLTDKKCNTNLLYHLWRGQGVNSSHYNHNDAMRGMNRPFHQGYANQPWFTFDLSAWNDKISCYQFRCPKEEFAETYASYHAAPAMGKKKGEMTPKGLLDWFIAEGYGDVVPESGTSEVQEEKNTKS